MKSGIIYLILPIFIILLFAIQKDRYEAKPNTIFERQNWSLYDVLLWALFFNVNIVLILYVIQWALMAKVVLWAFSFVSLYIVFKIRVKESLSILGLSKKGIFRDIIYGLKITIIYMLVSDGITYILPNPEKQIPIIQGGYMFWDMYKNTPLVILSLAFLVILIGPVIEEFIFRGFIYSPFRRKIGKWGAIFLTSTVFAFYHFRFFMIFGIILAYIYEKRGSLISSITAHVFFNLVHVITFIYVTDFLDLGYQVNIRGYLGITMLVFFAIYAIILLVGTKQDVLTDNTI